MTTMNCLCCFSVVLVCIIFVPTGIHGDTVCASCDRSKCTAVDDCPKGQKLVMDECNCCMSCEDENAPAKIPKRVCRPDQFACATIAQCIPKSWVCDNVPDCIDHSDEKECNYDPCLQITCPRGKVCLLNIQGLPVCRCPSLAICKMKRRKKDVCGRDGVSYASRCHLRVQECNSGKRIRVAHKGPCKKSELLKHNKQDNSQLLGDKKNKKLSRKERRDRRRQRRKEKEQKNRRLRRNHRRFSTF
ncbi:follistatin [Lingula anatina]|uniref:Follistatin n=1 Tax=Lingula anatina TaxID=7574 RepID=A0A1S3HWK4_LINAN|nr:follistatin [Lingula anatina]|eukprot:XP_013390415.1 follistatin [Lingula anatina]